MPASSTPPRRLRRLLALISAGAATVALGVAGAVAPLDGPAGTPGAVALEPEAGVRVSVAPADGAAVSAGAAIEVEVEVVNGSDAIVPAGTLALGVAASGIADADDLDAWLDADDRPPGSREIEERPSTALPVGAAVTYRFTLPADATDAGDPVIGLAASLEVEGVAVAGGTTAVANTKVADDSRPGLALAYPLTVPAGVDGLIPADRLESWTGPSGLLTRQLDAVTGLPVAIGIDPRIPASIRALGTTAPESAVSWLESLSLMPNEVFPLAYADADLAVQSQAGLTAPLEPLGFADALDPADFGGDQGVAAATAEPGEAPTDGQLLDWEFTRSDLAWPADDTVAGGDLDAFAAGGLTTAILAPGNVEAVDGAPGAASTIDGRGAVVADARVQQALRGAAAAETGTQWRGAASRLLAELAVSPADGDVTLLATFARSAGADAEHVGDTLRALNGSTWSRPATLAEAVGAPPTARTLVSLPEDGQRVDNVGRLLTAEAGVDEFSDVLTDPSRLTWPTRRELLALLATGWLAEPTEWTAAVGSWLVDQRAVTDSVRVVPSSSVLVVASETGIPVTVENDLPYAVDVIVTVDPSNGRLLVQDSVEATVEGQSRRTIRVPVEAGVGSGEVDLEVSLASPGGTPIGRTETIPANVHADWEGVGAAVLAAVAILVFAVGVIRTVRRRQRERSGAGTDPTDAPSTTEADSTEAAPEPPADAPRPDRPEDPSHG
ncbi:hypothetical protein GCM10009819_15090 [Agromyces tropicus]|uniref:2-oxoglutarate dehydrogenase n=1 Tax=Agromyces tropicus TaxID=555371 RepID=A0ABP5FR00_9MICO